MKEIKEIISVGRGLVDSVDLNGNETSWIKERLGKLEDENTQITTKIEGRRKKLVQGMEFYSLSERVIICR